MYANVCLLLFASLRYVQLFKPKKVYYKNEKKVSIQKKSLLKKQNKKSIQTKKVYYFKKTFKPVAI